jgi:hypothetical protein
MEYALVKTLDGGEPKSLVPTFKEWGNAAKAASKLFYIYTNRIVEELRDEYYDPQTNIRIQVCEIHP